MFVEVSKTTKQAFFRSQTLHKKFEYIYVFKLYQIELE